MSHHFSFLMETISFFIGSIEGIEPSPLDPQSSVRTIKLYQPSKPFGMVSLFITPKGDVPNMFVERPIFLKEDILGILVLVVPSRLEGRSKERKVFQQPVQIQDMDFLLVLLQSIQERNKFQQIF